MPYFNCGINFCFGFGIISQAIERTSFSGVIVNNTAIVCCTSGCRDKP